MVRFVHKGNFKKSDQFFQRMLENVRISDLDKYGRLGVEALASATPIDTGNTASSWYYEIRHTKGRSSIIFRNSHIEKDCPIAIILQYGHATNNGGFVEGRDYINPAMQPVFDVIAKDAWEEVTKA